VLQVARSCESLSVVKSRVHGIALSAVAAALGALLAQTL
jgi:hypothetical protein